MAMFVAPGAVGIVASAIAALLAWILWHRARQALKYDLHKVPGPQQAPLLGNLASVIGSSYLHRVSHLTRLLPGNHAHRALADSRSEHAGRRTNCLNCAADFCTLLNTIATSPFTIGRLHLTSHVQVLAQWTTQFGSVFKWSLAGKAILVITDPDEVHKLCGRDAHLTTRPRFVYGLLNSVRLTVW